MDTIVWPRIEAAIVFVSVIALFAYLDHSLAWWLAAILFFLPDVDFARSVLGPKAGAVVYNVLHVYALGTVLLAVGFAIGSGTFAADGQTVLDKEANRRLARQDQEEAFHIEQHSFLGV